MAKGGESGRRNKGRKTMKGRMRRGRKWRGKKRREGWRKLESFIKPTHYILHNTSHNLFCCIP